MPDSIDITAGVGLALLNNNLSKAQIIHTMSLKNYDVNQRGRADSSPLSHAIESGYVEWVKIFLELGANPNALQNGKSMLELEIPSNNKQKILTLLKLYGAFTSDKLQKNIFYKNAEKDDLLCLKRKFNYYFQYLYNPNRALEGEELEFINILKSRLPQSKSFIDALKSNPYGSFKESIFSYACRRSHIGAVSLFLETGILFSKHGDDDPIRDASGPNRKKIISAITAEKSRQKTIISGSIVNYHSVERQLIYDVEVSRQTVEQAVAKYQPSRRRFFQAHPGPELKALQAWLAATPDEQTYSLQTLKHVLASVQGSFGSKPDRLIYLEDPEYNEDTDTTGVSKVIRDLGRSFAPRQDVASEQQVQLLS